MVLTPPSEAYVAEKLAVVDPQRIHTAAKRCASNLLPRCATTGLGPTNSTRSQVRYTPDPVSSGKRSLANLALSMLCLDAVAQGDAVWPGRAYQRFKDAAHMTDRLGALAALVNAHAELATPALERFHAMFKGEALVIDKWFALQAAAPEVDGRVFARALELLKHPDFSIRNPNRARSLITSLCMMNPAAFHRADAAGYAFWADRVLELDAVNPATGRAHGPHHGPLEPPGRALPQWGSPSDQPRRPNPTCQASVREIVSRALAS